MQASGQDGGSAVEALNTGVVELKARIHNDDKTEFNGLVCRGPKSCYSLT